MKFVVTGGAGFIGSCFVRHLIERQPDARVTVIDKLTYCGDETRLESLADHPRHRFVRLDIRNRAALLPLLDGADGVFHFAAESHVDRSLQDCMPFFETNAAGTQDLLEVAREAGVRRFLFVSTDEVYGSVSAGFSKETDAAAPTNPYSVSKAAGEFLALNAWKHAGLEVLITRGSNTYGPYQYPEKMIPLFVSNLLAGQPVPLYGDGLQERDWLFVEDHARAVWKVFEGGKAGEIYNISGSRRLTNLELTQKLLKLTGRDESLIRRVADRFGHDRRYALDDAKIRGLGFKPETDFEKGIALTVEWYRRNGAWIERIRRKGGEFEKYYRSQYEGQGTPASGPRP